MREFRDFNHVTVADRLAEEVAEATDVVALVRWTRGYGELYSRPLQLQKQLAMQNRRLVGTDRVVDLDRKTSRATDPEESSLEVRALGYWTELSEWRQPGLVQTKTDVDWTILPAISTIEEPILLESIVGQTLPILPSCSML